MNYDRWTCGCVEGYKWNENGTCARDCEIFGDEFLYTCHDNVNECCCEDGYTYGYY